jgi:hypothetical protein
VCGGKGIRTTEWAFRVNPENNKWGERPYGDREMSENEWKNEWGQGSWGQRKRRRKLGTGKEKCSGGFGDREREALPGLWGEIVWVRM